MDQPIQILVRADDLGSSHAANVACLKSLREGIARSTELMAPCAWFPEAVNLLKDLPDHCDVGVHLTLTSEWENVKWRPLTRCPSLVDDRGFFLPRIWPRHDGDLCLRNVDWKLEEIEAEFRAQIELCLEATPRVTHLSYHMGCHHGDPRITELCQALASAYQLDTDPEDHEYKSVPRPPEEQASDDPIQALAERLEALPPGRWMLIEHPSLDTPEMQGISDTDGIAVARQRNDFTLACCSDLVTEVVRRRKIQLMSYSDLS